MKIPAEKTPVNPHTEAAGQAHPGRKSAAPQSGLPLSHSVAAGKAGQTAGASRNAGSRVVPGPAAGAETPQPGQAAARQAAPADNRLSSLLSVLKLPNDSLSESIVSFSRYFSLPLENSSVLRRDALVQKKREAAALGAAAASDKGLVLDSRALSEYADAIDPAEWREQQEQKEEPGQGRQGNQEQRQQGQDAGQPEAEELKRQVTAALGKGPVPDFINRIPGKNGRRWIVVPFLFSGEGFDLRVSFRILLPDPDDTSGETGRFAADIAVFREKALSRRWFFLLEGSCAGDFKAKRAEFSVSPPVSDNKTLIRELVKLFTLPDNKITLNKKGNFTDSRDDLLRTVNEAV
jgi:hypothetical protein